MRFELSRFGGLAALSRPALIVETSSLGREQAQQLEELVSRADFWRLPAELSSARPIPDAQSHELTIVDAEQRHSVGFDLRSAPAALVALVTALRAAARG